MMKTSPTPNSTNNARLLHCLLAVVFLLPANGYGAAGARGEQIFWNYWSDGKAELNGYELHQPRYGELRHGRAVLVYVTEPFSRSRHVKVNLYDRADPDQFVVLKLNHIRKFQTGIYDYSLMTSVFADPAREFATVKISFSSQEWCGNLYHEILFPSGRVESRVRSYFDGESGEQTLKPDGPYWTEDGLFITLRTLASQQLDTRPRRLPLLLSAARSRLLHRPMAFHETEINWSTATQRRRLPFGEFEVRQASYRRDDGTRCTVSLEVDYPHRIVAWRCQDGEQALLTGSLRLDYWRTHRESDEKLLRQLGLEPVGYAPDGQPEAGR